MIRLVLASLVAFKLVAYAIDHSPPTVLPRDPPSYAAAYVQLASLQPRR
jgi:hypothetical protein